MSEAPSPLRETVLRQCQAATPGSWSPGDYAAATGMSVEALYAPLNDLRLGGFVELTEWQQGKGQGYIITPLGQEVLENPTFLAQLRTAGATVPLDRVSATPSPTLPAGTRYARGEEVRYAWYYGSTAGATKALLAINILAFFVSFALAMRAQCPFLAFISHGDPGTLHKMGTLGADDLAKGEWWRIVSNCFLHYGLMHLALNMISLYMVRKAEALWGAGRFLVLYLISGVCGSCIAIYVHPGSPDTGPVYLAGASGALWGVMASLAAWLVLNRSHLPPAEVRQWLQRISVVLLLNVGVSMLPRVSASAHFAGGAAGFLVATLLQITRYGPRPKRLLAGLQLALLPVLCILALYTAFENDPRLMRFKDFEQRKRDRPRAEEFRRDCEARVRPLVTSLDKLDERSTSLYPKAAAKRNVEQVEKIKNELAAFATQANDVKAWLDGAAPVEAGKPLQDASRKLIEAMTALAEARGNQFANDAGPEASNARKAWIVARLLWDAELAKKL